MPVRSSLGFTLIEMLIVVTMIGILAAIAIPNYSAYIQRGHRSEAKGVLMQGAQWMERFRTENNRYDRAPNGTAVALPASLQRSPASGGLRYTVAVVADDRSYLLTATPTGAQTGDQCGSFTINQVGQRTVVIGGTTYTPGAAQFDQCWGR
jgi:type IV pilus assembly protein PilE